MKKSKKQEFIDLVYETSYNREWENEMNNLCETRPDSVSFMQWVKDTEWTLGAIIAFFQYQCICLNGDMDWVEFEDDYFVFKSKIYGVI
jgi:hypothetical protein